MEISYRELSLDELEVVCELAHRIWPRVYGEMISGEQIDFMLGEMNSVAAMKAAVETIDARFWLVEIGGEGIGYFAIYPVLGEALFLDKLYLLPEFHGAGHGSAALGEVIRIARSEEWRELRLRVNRMNERAIRCYARNGFEISEEVCSDIGGGFVMDDFLMRRML